MERNRLSRAMAFNSRRDQHDPTDGLAVLDTRLRVVLRPRRRVSRRHVVSRLISIISGIYVCSQRVQTHLSSTRIRNGNHLGHASWNHRGRHSGHDYGIDNTFDLWIMVSLRKQSRGHFCKPFRFIQFRSMCSDLVYVILFPQVSIISH